MAVQAGPWIQDHKGIFTSASATLRQTAMGDWRHELNYYGEYGWSDHLTLGLDLHQNHRDSGHAMLFARLPLGRRNGSFPVAVSLSVGGAHWQGRWDGIYRVTLSAGHGFPTRTGSGWATIDATYERRAAAPDPLWKLDATLGFNRHGALSPMLQIETSKSPGQALSYAIIPSLRYRITAQKELVVGLERKQAANRSLGLRIALWHRF
ncbi:hypothetical protein PXK00_15305 [Phaeobacter sp. QD34_3]|uniref:hypothetical protein n=1 Tax=unclassified Phaeobacter TaxID=2621772 RepID=UPI00237F1127|nr:MULTISPECIES: hypothetical protein [unclassified Phaeobacter]MDE4134486.1 hypothetical protein [Phaeobacter sp. QD34_3]MDE4138124.1 hypothetical protein [Phaeobacter sp. QD34_24]MDE4176429.1 hypothetical protein [Phaeobacter sp. PT47_59]